MIRTIPLVLALIVGVCAQLEGQEPGRSTRDSDPGPISTLLRLQDELSLTAAQVQELTAIEARIDQLNQPLVARIMEVRRRIRALGPRDDMSAENRALFESYIAEARPLMREINRNNRAGMRDVGDVLTESQKETIGRLLKERANRDRGRGNSRSQDRRN